MAAVKETGESGNSQWRTAVYAVSAPDGTAAGSSTGDREAAKSAVLETLGQAQMNTTAWQAVAEGTKIVPLYWLQEFVAQGWKVTIGELPNGWSGFAESGTRTITFVPSSTIFDFCHEFGHFIQFSTERTDFFEDLFQKGKNAPVLRDYARTDCYEYFADCFATLLLDSGKAAQLAEQAPETYTFIQDGVINANGPVSLSWFYDMPFADVSPEKWYYEPIAKVAGTGMMKGVGGERFAPEGKVSRAMVAAVLWRLAGEPDVPDTGTAGSTAAMTSAQAQLPAQSQTVAGGTGGGTAAWYTQAVQWVLQEGIAAGSQYADQAAGNTAGSGERTAGAEFDISFFRPDEPATREDLITMLHRTAEYIGRTGNPGNFTGILFYRGNISSFSDKGEISSYAVDSAKWGLAHDLMTGVDDERYAPKADTTRAELAAILDRWQTMLDRYVTVSVEHSSGSGN